MEGQREAPIIHSVPNRKRKMEESDEVRELKQKAKYHCKDIKEWRIVSKYSQKKLEEYLQDQTFLEGAKVAQDFGSFITDIYGFVLDKITKGDGFVEAEVKNDLSLRNAIQRELIEYVKHITNRLQVVIFSGADVLQGKKKQRNGTNDQTSQGINVDEFRDRVSQPIVEEWNEHEYPGPSEPTPGQTDQNREEEEVYGADQ